MRSSRRWATTRWWRCCAGPEPCLRRPAGRHWPVSPEPTPIADRIPITGTLSLDAGELEFSFIRSSGPGGQNVNKVSSAVQLRFDLAGSPSLPEPVRARALRAAGSRLTGEGVIVISADRFRSQPLNRADAVERLVALLAAAAVPPKPRRATRPTLGSKVRRLEAKTRRGGIKKLRAGRPPLE